MKKQIKIIGVIVSILFTFLGCEPGNELRVNGEQKISYALPFGNIEIVSSITGGYYFRIEFRYDLNNSSNVNSSKISVYVNSEIVVSEFRWLEEMPEIFELVGNGTILLTFQREFQLGDVIEVKSSPGAVTYNGEPLTIPQLTVVIDELNKGNKGIIPWLREKWSKGD